jgi:hypothetical protein
MIDLVYKVGTSSQGENYSELRHSIRSAVRHFKDLGQIYIIGFKPGWLDASRIVHIPLSDPYKNCKDANLISKLILACYDKSLSSRFLNMSDDYFFLQDCDVSFFEIARYSEEVLKIIEKKKLEGKVLSKWERRVEASCNALKVRGYEAKCFDVHMPVLIDKELYPKTLLSYDYGVDNGYCGNTLYFNSIKVKTEALEVNDLVRLIDKILDINELQTFIGSKRLLNYTISSYNLLIENYLRDKFTEKSVYEI